MPKLSQPKMLASFDLATKTGWCRGIPQSGDKNFVWGRFDLRTKKDESWGMKLIRFESKLRELLPGVGIVIYERPAGQFGADTTVIAKLAGILEKYCEENGIDYRAYSATEIKKFATGKGNAGKPAVIKAVQERFGYDGDDDNEADAIALFHLAKEDLKL